MKTFAARLLAVEQCAERSRIQTTAMGKGGDMAGGLRRWNYSAPALKVRLKTPKTPAGGF